MIEKHLMYMHRSKKSRKHKWSYKSSPASWASCLLLMSIFSSWRSIILRWDQASCLLYRPIHCRGRSEHSGLLSMSEGDQEQKGPSFGRWVWSIGRQAGPWVPRVVRMSVSAKKSPRQSHHLFQEGGPLPGPETGLLSNTWKWIVRGDTCTDKTRDFIGKGHPGGEQ